MIALNWYDTILCTTYNMAAMAGGFDHVWCSVHGPRYAFQRRIFQKKGTKKICPSRTTTCSWWPYFSSTPWRMRWAKNTHCLDGLGFCQGSEDVHFDPKIVPVFSFFNIETQKGLESVVERSLSFFSSGLTGVLRPVGALMGSLAVPWPWQLLTAMSQEFLWRYLKKRYSELQRSIFFFKTILL